MRNIIYKYNVGDIVELKEKHRPEVEIPYVGAKVKVGLCKITEHRDYNGPCYRFEGLDGFWQEACIAGLATESEFLAQQALVSKVAKEQGPETKCDTGDSGEFEVLPLEEAKWYRISFSAKLTPDDLRAMKKCFFDAMNESMEIYDLENLVIEEA
jgi:hypothetical protein